ncbi:MAG TPA: aminodeoxychorismate synthase component I [Rhizomicrobium sp.]|jgi:para-aminobenzoate synthetase/4-amino-4-deoxychorismate lyase
MGRPEIFLENPLRRYRDPRAIVVAHAPDEVPAALAAIEAGVKAGRHAAGYLAYELGYTLEPRLGPLMPSARKLPLLWFGLFDDFETEPALAAAGRAYAGPLRHEWNEADYNTRYARVHDAIAAGDIYQANLSFRSRFAFLGDPMALYRDLRARAAAPHCAYVDDGERQILSLSPELFFDLAADGTLTARPMKGTAARGSDAVSDALARNGLRESTKDRAENLMIVDLLRNDLGRIAALGSVTVKELFAVETYPTVHQMTSTITAKLAPNGVAVIVRALFPCGSVTGAPKIRAMQIIRELEASPRGVYCGAIGHFAPDGSARFNVAIRTITVQDGQGELGIGGAIVHDSTAAGEYAECLLKARYFTKDQRPIGLIETLPWDGSFVRVERHLARMAKSAAALGIPFDEDAARRALAVVAGDAPLRVRLTLDEAGNFVCTTAPLPPNPPFWTYAISDARVTSSDALLRHKIDWRELYDVTSQADEVLFLNERGELAEGSRSTIFLRIAGNLLTPPLSAGVLDGVLRRELLESGKCREAVLTLDDLARADEVLLGNSLRGLISSRPVRKAG